jgi:hypothetical protein
MLRLRTMGVAVAMAALTALAQGSGVASADPAPPPAPDLSQPLPQTREIAGEGRRASGSDSRVKCGPDARGRAGLLSSVRDLLTRG